MKINFTKIFFAIFFATIVNLQFVSGQTIIFSEDFEGVTPPAMPTDWIMVDGDGLTPNSQVNFVTDAWVTRNSGGNTYAISTSWYTPAGTSNDWMITPQITLTAGCFLKWSATVQDPAFPDGYKVMISTATTDTTDFNANAPLLTINAENDFWTQRQVSLAAYAGQNVYLAFINNSEDKFLLWIDSIEVYQPTGDDAGVVTIKAPNNNGCQLSSAETITATIQNFGVSAISNFNVSYQIDGGTPVTETVSSTINPGLTLDYSFSATADLSVSGSYDITVSTSLSGDINSANDALSKIVGSTTPFDFNAGSLSMGFETFDDFSTWKISEDANGDNQTWVVRTDGGNSGDGYVSINAHTINNNNDWFFTSCLNLEAGSPYKLSFYLSADSIRNFKVMLGTAPNAASMTQTVSDMPNVSTAGYQNMVTTINVSSTGTYYLGFQDYSVPDLNFPRMNIDDLFMYKVSPIDAAVTNIVSPSTTGCTLSAADSVTITIANIGTSALSNFDVSYSIDGGAPITETVLNIILPDSTFDYTFATTADLSAVATYNILAYTSVIGDGGIWNDTSFSGAISLNPISTLPFTMGFETTDDLSGWLLNDVNDDGASWFTIINTAFAHTGDGSIALNPSLLAQDDWLFTPCVDLVSGTNYSLSFFYASGTGSESLKVSIGNTANADSMTTDLVTLSDFTDTLYSQRTANFTVPSNGLYHFGFNAFSIANQSFIVMDDINLGLAVVPAADFSFTGSPTVQFTDGSTNFPTSWLWNFGDGTTNITQNPSHIYADKDSSYTVCLKVTNIAGSDSICKTVTVTETGLMKNTLDGFVKFYPNPSTGKFIIHSSIDKLQIEIYNILGEEILKSEIQNPKSEIDLSAQPNGVYFIKLKANGETTTQKIVIAR